VQPLQQRRLRGFQPARQLRELRRRRLLRRQQFPPLRRQLLHHRALQRLTKCGPGSPAPCQQRVEARGRQLPSSRNSAPAPESVRFLRPFRWHTGQCTGTGMRPCPDALKGILLPQAQKILIGMGEAFTRERIFVRSTAPPVPQRHPPGHHLAEILVVRPRQRHRRPLPEPPRRTFVSSVVNRGTLFVVIPAVPRQLELRFRRLRLPSTKRQFASPSRSSCAPQIRLVRVPVIQTRRRRHAPLLVTRTAAPSPPRPVSRPAGGRNDAQRDQQIRSARMDHDTGRPRDFKPKSRWLTRSLINHRKLVGKTKTFNIPHSNFQP